MSDATSTTHYNILQNLPDSQGVPNALTPHMWHDSFVCVTWLIPYLTWLIFVCVAWLIRVCDMTHSYVTWIVQSNVWYDSMTCDIHVWHDSHVTRLTHMWYDSFTCDMTHSYVTWIIQSNVWYVICDITHWHVTWLIHMWHKSFAWLNHMWSFKCDMTHSYVTWLIESNVWNDSLTCDMTH